MTSLLRRMTDRWRRLPVWAAPALRWTLGLGIVALLLTRLDGAAVLRNMASADLALAVPSIIGLVAVQSLGAVAWRELTRTLTGQAMGWGQTLRMYYVAQGLGALTPGNLGADVFRIARGGDGGGGVGWRANVLPILVQRVTSTLALVALGLGAFLLLPSTVNRPVLVFIVGAVLAVASAAGILAIGWWAGSRPDQAPSRPTRQRLAQAAGIGLILGGAFHAASIGLGAVLVSSLTSVSDPWPILACAAIARLSILVPISPSALGIQEGALSLLFVQIGMPPEIALAAALLNRLALVATAVVGGLLLVAGSRRTHLRLAPSPQPGSGVASAGGRAGRPARVR